MKSITLPTASDPLFASFSESLLAPTVVAQLARETGWEPASLRGRLSLALGEAAQTLRLLDGLELRGDARLLEVGAGLGLTSAFLSSIGLAVTALEPAGIGFAEHAVLAAGVGKVVGSSHVLLTIGAADLDPAMHGRFDLVFSNNVLEHVDDLGAAIAGMHRVLADDGLMVHSCPNYSVPFEPHFGIPLVPGRPGWTGRVLPSSIADSPVWRSLNFVRARDVRRIARTLDLRVGFRGGALAASVERLGTDPEFRSRHRLLAVVGRVLVALRMNVILGLLPATWATPMDFTLNPGTTAPESVRKWMSR